MLTVMTMITNNENTDCVMVILHNKEDEIEVKLYHQSNVIWTGDEVNDPNPPQVPFKWLRIRLIGC